jgi:hypothetical protein
VPADPLAAPRQPGPVRRVASYALVLLLSVLLAVWGAFFVPLRVGGVPVPVGLLLALAPVPLVLAGRRTSGSRWGGAGPYLLWVAVVLRLAASREEGDLVLPGSGTVGALSLAFLGVGVVAGGCALGLAASAPRRRDR